MSYVRSSCFRRPAAPVTLARTLLLLAIATVFSARAAAADKGVTTKLGFETSYVSYGTKFAENVFVPMIDAFNGDYYAGIWGYMPVNKDGGGYDFDGEWDFFAGRTLKLNKLVSIDVGGTLYQYPGVTTDATTFEGFFWLNFALPLQPKLKLYYDFTINNWIGETMISHSLPLSKKTALNLTGRVGFRRPEHTDAWLYATATMDWVYQVTEKTQWAVGARMTNNTDHTAVGHSFHSWVGSSFTYTW
jgi:hypothetical protein